MPLFRLIRPMAYLWLMSPTQEVKKIKEREWEHAHIGYKRTSRSMNEKKEIGLAGKSWKMGDVRGKAR